MAEFTIRNATQQDCGLILEFIKELAVYEKMLPEVVATEQMLEEVIFRQGRAEVIFAVEDGVEVGFALFFHNIALGGRGANHRIAGDMTILFVFHIFNTKR